MKATTGQLHKRLRRAEEEAHRDHRIMTGRQMLRMVLGNYQTDATAKETFNITHLHELPFLGDDCLAEFLDAWLRLLGDQEELLFYNKVKSPIVLKSYLDYYYRLPDDAPEHSYEYLLQSVETYLTQKA